MQDRIINILVSVVMVVISLYPMYNHLKSTVDGVNDVINETNQSIALVNKEIVKFQNDLKSISSQVDSVKHEIQVTIDEGLTDTKNIINKEIEQLQDKITNMKSNAIDDVKTKTLDLIPGLKLQWIR